MKSVKAICPAVVLALALSATVFAGDVETPGAPKQLRQTLDSSDSGSVATAVCSTTDDLYASGYADILMVLTSIF